MYQALTWGTMTNKRHGPTFLPSRGEDRQVIEQLKQCKTVMRNPCGTGFEFKV